MAELLLPISSGNDDLYTEIIKENIDNRVLIFNDEVNDSLIENYILYILKWNREDKDIEPSKRRKILIAETLFPEPDSPTIPTVFPSSSVYDTSLTAFTIPFFVLK